MAKKQKAQFGIIFEGLDVVLTKVTVIEVDLVDGYHWMHLSRKGNQWIMLKTPGYLFEPMNDELQIINIDRSDPDAPYFLDYFCDRMPISKHTELRFNQIDNYVYALDEVEDGTRIQYTDTFMGKCKHSDLKRILIKKVTN